ncbi:hypothetical protein AJ80_06160 [Polytolypa hystricis UAMH7299]|uniref:Uncharacterized protein n=1 Tax=Polytolypa hystricis (strain UAMH7299) TaxID=1447883 RepID=A0A2B7XYN5_POLH7|nr:hypothetical protein AJ80_06160 [Polytolypa hystricis UAMH7299]
MSHLLTSEPLDWTTVRPRLLTVYESWLREVEPIMASSKSRNGDVEEASCSETTASGPQTRGILTRVCHDENALATTELQTPRSRQSKRAKRVRFSDPGPQLECAESPTSANLSTGLTPAVSKTRINIGDRHDRAGLTSAGKRRLSQPARRHSAPITRSESPKMTFDMPRLPETRTYQFLPSHDAMDRRTMRRIARSRLSAEMNKVEELKKKKRKDDKAKDEELADLRHELSLLKDVKREMEGEAQVTPTTPERLSELSVARRKIEDLEALLNAHENTGAFPSCPSPSPAAGGDDDMYFLADDVTMEDDMVEISSSPIRSRIGGQLSPSGSDASTQADLKDPRQRAEMSSIRRQLEQSRKEKIGLFKSWRSVLHSHGKSTGPPTLPTPASTPPPDFIAQIIDSFRAAMTRESNAVAAVEKVYNDLSSHGYQGSNAIQIITNMHEHFRQARLELERAVPGETPDADLTDWSRIIDLLVERIKLLVKELGTSQEKMAGFADQEKALRGQFNATLRRLEQATKKNENLEQAGDGMAEDMLHARMKIQRLERDIHGLGADKSRLAAAMENYRADIKILETLNMKLEDDTNLANVKVSELEEEARTTTEKMTGLENDLSKEKTLRDEVKAELEQRTKNMVSLEERLGQLEAQKREAIAALEKAAEQQSQYREKEIGALNVRLSGLATSLNEARNEVEQLRADKASAENKLRAFQRLFSEDAIQAAYDRVHETANILDGWKQGMAMLDEVGDSPPGAAANKHNTATDGFAAIGSEPITPAPERFMNVEFERGKKRKRKYDSGVAIAEEEDEEYGGGGDWKERTC